MKCKVFFLQLNFEFVLNLYFKVRQKMKIHRLEEKRQPHLTPQITQEQAHRIQRLKSKKLLNLLKHIRIILRQNHLITITNRVLNLQIYLIAMMMNF